MGMKKGKRSKENHTHLGKSILIKNILYEYGIFHMGMKKANRSKENHTHLGYSVLI